MDNMQFVVGALMVEKAMEKPLPVKIAEPINLDRVVRFRASDETVDRTGDVILATSWELGEFVSNPIITAFHDNYTRWPLGHAVAAGVIDRALYIDCEFDPPELDAEADKVLGKIRHGTIRAGSVGFMAAGLEIRGKSKRADLFEQFPTAQRIFTKSILYEFTVCPVPANPSALVEKMRERYAAKDGNVTVADNAARKETEENEELEPVSERAASVAVEMRAEIVAENM